MALQITPLPPAPQRTDPPSVFVPKADAHVASLVGFVTETNALATEVEANAVFAEDSASTAAANANFIGEWATKPDGSPRTGALNVPASAANNGTTWQLLSNVADVTAVEPGVSAVWQAITPDPQTSINTAAISTVLPQTVSGLLTAGGRVNQIRDSGAFTMPLANSVLADTVLIVELPSRYAAETPTLTRTGGDLLEDKDGTDTDIVWEGAAKLEFTSNGVDNWSL